MVSQSTAQPSVTSHRRAAYSFLLLGVILYVVPVLFKQQILDGAAQFGTLAALFGMLFLSIAVAVYTVSREGGE